MRDGEIQTACQQVCPTEAIVFGDINDETSRVAQLKAQPHDYGLLAELGTRPRTTLPREGRQSQPRMARQCRRPRRGCPPWLS